MKITLIIGLPGSGKSFYAKQNYENVVDDPISNEQLEGWVEDFCIAHPQFCNKFSLTSLEKFLKIEYPNCLIKKIYFENNKHQCSINASKRLNKKVINYIKQLSKQYKIPENVTPLKVWKENEKAKN